MSKFDILPKFECKDPFAQLYKLYQNDFYWDMIEFSDFFQYVMIRANLDLNTYVLKISLVLPSIRILVSVEKLHAIIETLVIFTFGVGTLDWSSEPVQCALCE